MKNHNEVGIHNDGHRFAWGDLGSRLLLALIRNEVSDAPVCSRSMYCLMQLENDRQWLLKAAFMDRGLAESKMRDDYVLFVRRVNA